ncbi:MAG: hypothetical protein OEV45_02215, partial [Desulfobacteraceae bacterium]|nr:hypothetical protein [Desulfobacteraceae bacterium]
MKRVGKIFWGVLCMILVFAFSHASEIHWVTSNKVTVEWDAPTTYVNGVPIKPGYELRYFVYLDEDVDKNHKNKVLMSKEPIASTNYQIVFNKQGRYFVGVKAALYKVEGGKISGVPESESEISWSYRKTCTN